MNTDLLVTSDFTKHFKNSKIFPKNEEKGPLFNSFYEASITLILNPDKEIIRKENRTPISLMNIDTEILNKILACQIQQRIKRIIHRDQVGFIPGMQGWLNVRKSVNTIHHINRLKKKKST